MISNTLVTKSLKNLIKSVKFNYHTNSFGWFHDAGS